MSTPFARARVAWLLAACLVLASAVLASSALAAPSKRAAVVARGSCTEVRGKQLVATFDVVVRGRRSAKAKRGRGNRVTGGRVVGRLPTRFRPGTTRRALRVAFAKRSKRASWHLRGRTASVRRSAARCAAKRTSAPAPPESPAS